MQRASPALTSSRAVCKDLLGAKSNVITWLVFLTLHRNWRGYLLATTHTWEPCKQEQPGPPRDTTALIKQKQNPTCDSCS